MVVKFVAPSSLYIAVQMIDLQLIITSSVHRADAHSIRARLHQTSASTLRQLCDDANDSVLIENNGVTPEWGYKLFSRDSTDFNENRIASVIAELSQR